MIYILERTGKLLNGEISQMLVRASQESVARRFAADHCGKEGPIMWLDKKFSTAILVEDMGKPEILDSKECW